MPRKIPLTITFDAAEDEILFTRAALRADPDAEDLLSMTDGWMALVEGPRQKERAAREAVINADAMRAVANGRLDAACTDFAGDLWVTVGRERSARWRQFFGQPVSRFVRQALSRQVTTVLAWLGSTDEALGSHRGELERWAKAANEALVRTRATALVRGEAWQSREEMAEELGGEQAEQVHQALQLLELEQPPAPGGHEQREEPPRADHGAGMALLVDGLLHEPDGAADPLGQLGIVLADEVERHQEHRHEERGHLVGAGGHGCTSAPCSARASRASMSTSSVMAPTRRSTAA